MLVANKHFRRFGQSGQRLILRKVCGTNFLGPELVVHHSLVDGAMQVLVPLATVASSVFIFLPFASSVFFM